MVKMVISDLDGTLLKQGEKALSSDVFKLLQELKEKDIIFAVASGRSYGELKKLFAHSFHDIIFVCENGALILYRGKILDKTPIPAPIADTFLQELLCQSKYQWLAAGVYTCYTNSAFEGYLPMLKERGIQPMKIRTKEQIPEPLLRISVYRPSNHPFREWTDDLKTSYQDESWMDFTAKEVNKGEALLKLKKLFLQEQDEVLAFGNGENDLEMLHLAEHSYLVG